MMTRVLRLLEQWLPLLACYSGVVVPVSQVIPDGVASDAATAPDLDAQLHEILDFVLLQEQMWPPCRIKGPINRKQEPG